MHLLVLPNELLLRVFELSASEPALLPGETITESHKASSRGQTLLALSSSCRRLRRFYEHHEKKLLKLALKTETGLLFGKALVLGNKYRDVDLDELRNPLSLSGGMWAKRQEELGEGGSSASSTDTHERAVSDDEEDILLYKRALINHARIGVFTDCFRRIRDPLRRSNRHFHILMMLLIQVPIDFLEMNEVYDFAIDNTVKIAAGEGFGVTPEPTKWHMILKYIVMNARSMPPMSYYNREKWLDPKVEKTIVGNRLREWLCGCSRFDDGRSDPAPWPLKRGRWEVIGYLLGIWDKGLASEPYQDLLGDMYPSKEIMSRTVELFLEYERMIYRGPSRARNLSS